MRRPWLLCLTLSRALGLLEERIVSFESAAGSLPIHGVSIVYSVDDPVGVAIAATSLAEDLEAITGTRPSVFGIGGRELVECANCTENVIIAATVPMS